MNILAWIILGGVAGWIASIIMGTNHRQGLLLDIVLGIVGAIVGGFAFNAFGASGVTGFDFRSLIVATIGAVVLLAIGKMFRRAPL